MDYQSGASNVRCTNIYLFLAYEQYFDKIVQDDSTHVTCNIFGVTQRESDNVSTIIS
jgi:hypothetical protein